MILNEIDLIETMKEIDLREMIWEINQCLKWEDKKYNWLGLKIFYEAQHLLKLD